MTFEIAKLIDSCSTQVEWIRDYNPPKINGSVNAIAGATIKAISDAAVCAVNQAKDAGDETLADEIINAMMTSSEIRSGSRFIVYNSSNIVHNSNH